MKFREPPNTEDMKLDFSEFHPLDHPLWSCRGYPGGRKQHIKYKWEFMWRPRVRALTRCKVGLHSEVQCWAPRDKKTRTVCADCSKSMSEWQPY